MNVLYTPEMLSAAVELADYPLLTAPSHSAGARSHTCGSEIVLHLELQADDKIKTIGMQVKACAVGQAAAAVFARHAIGLEALTLGESLDCLERWVKGEGNQPEWPDLHLIAAAVDYPARHSAMLLPWKAAVDALSSVPASR